MSEDRARILNMLAAGKISTEEAEHLLDALQARTAPSASSSTTESAIKGDPSALIAALPKFLYVKVDGKQGENVDVKIPLSLVRSGLKLTSLIPPQALDQINTEMGQHGMSIDFNNLKPEDIEELVESLREMEINVNSEAGETVRVYCA